MPIPILDATAWREYRGQPGRAGMNSTHIATIADASGFERLCFVKLAPDPNMPTLLCEAMGWVLAGHAGLTRPPFVAIVMVDVAKLHKSQALPSKVVNSGEPFCAAWCSQALAGKSVSQPNMGDLITDRKAFLRAMDSRKIAAFDEWTNLRDRNLGNVIRMNKGGYGVIDNETFLYDYLWPKSIALNSNRLIVDAKTALDSKNYTRFKVEMANAAKGHTGALASAEVDLESILRLIVPSALTAKETIFSLLEGRCKDDWLQKRLQVMA